MLDALEYDIPCLHLTQSEYDDEEVDFEVNYSHFDEILETVTEKLILQLVTMEEIVTEHTCDLFFTYIRYRLNEGEI